MTRRRCTVSAVIPTVGRPELGRAIDSVRAQTADVDVEVVVVFDGDPVGFAPESVAGADKVIVTGGRVGGAEARNLGIEAATGDHVALLDDDDEWLPGKLKVQLDALGRCETPDRAIVAGRHIHVDARTGRESQSGPLRLIRPGQSVDDYLFRRRSPHGGRASMYTSTLLCSTALAREVRWNSGLRRHQDWDWVIRLDRAPQVQVLQVAEPVVRIQTGSVGSISAGADWKSSLAWATDALTTDRAVLADFLAAQTLRYALHARSWQGIRETVAAIADSRRIPSPGPLVVGMAGLASRRMVEKATAATVRRSR